MMYLRLYADCVRQGLRGIGKGKWTLLLPALYAVAMTVAGMLLAPLGMAGGFVLGIVMDLLASSLLYFVGEAVKGATARPQELKQSFLAFFWPVVAVGFIVWVATWLLDHALAERPQIEMAIFGVAAVLLNAVPEVVYQKPSDGMTMLRDSVEFIQRHWIEWFIPNLALFGLWYEALRGWGRLEELLARDGVTSLGLSVAGGVLGLMALYTIGVVRGVLFRVLSTTSAFHLKTRYGRRPS